MRALNPDHLATLSEVIAVGSFSAAAQRLSLTQPAVSQQIRQLERRLGVRLIERVGKRARPTAAGAELLKHARHIEAAFDTAIAAVAAHRDDVVGRVRLGTGATACIYLLPRLLRSLRTRYPRLDIVVKTGNTPDILRDLEDNALDVALVTLPAPGRNFAVTPVLDDEFVAIFPVGERAPAIATPASLAERSVVLYEPGGHTQRLVADWFVRAGLSLRPVMELGSVEAIKRLVAAGLDCAILPRIAVTEDAKDGQFRIRPLSPRLFRKLGVVIRRDKPLGRSLREVVRALHGLRTRRGG
jgi:DNA-binding transcriptional LysR family regulator